MVPCCFLAILSLLLRVPSFRVQEFGGFGGSGPIRANLPAQAELLRHTQQHLTTEAHTHTHTHTPGADRRCRAYGICVA